MSICLIFNILDTLLANCKEALLSLNRREIAEFVGVPLILEMRCQVQIAYQKAKLNTIYSVSVIELATNLCFVLLKYTTPLKIVNTYPQIDFQLIGSNAWSVFAKACISSFLDIPTYSIIL